MRTLVALLVAFWCVPARAENPIATIGRAQAEAEIRTMLAQRHPDSSETQDLLLQENVVAFEELRQAPGEEPHSRILTKLRNRYYPDFSVILDCYKEEVRVCESLHPIPETDPLGPVAEQLRVWGAGTLLRSGKVLRVVLKDEEIEKKQYVTMLTLICSASVELPGCLSGVSKIQITNESQTQGYCFISAHQCGRLIDMSSDSRDWFVSDRTQEF